MTETARKCSTPAEIVDVWKVADFFGIPELCHQAETAMKRRLDESAIFLGFVPKRRAQKRADRGCENIIVVYDLCGHTVRESRACPVRYARPETVFYLCDPKYTIHRESACDRSRCQIRNQGGPANAPPGQQPAAPDDATRALIEDEIRMLCRALVLAITETPQGSCMQKELIRHMCTTRVALWEGFTVCRFLES